MILHLQKLIEEFNLNINTILHVGAHKCEELDKYHSINVTNDNIIWIEAIKELVDYNKNKNHNIKIFNYLVSDIDDFNYTFNIANNGQSSSIYDFGTHLKNHPEVKYIGTKKLLSKRIDTIFNIENIDLKIDFINIDIQGSELLALKGLGNILKDIKYIYTEINTEYVYKNCSLVSEIDDFLKIHNFYRIKTGFINEKWGWGDALYIKKNFQLNDMFICENLVTYPPFKNGLYMEEYFLNYHKNKINTKKTYIPVLWTNFQIRKNIDYSKMQIELDNWILQNENTIYGYYTVVQYDDGPKLKLPSNTVIYGACSGNEILPLIYEDKNNTLEKKQKLKFSEKNIKCSFVGTNTHKIRNIIKSTFTNKKNYVFNDNNSWTDKVNIDKQNNFITTTLKSKFAFAPRGYGRSSFRFFEIMKLGTVPIYVWDDIEWLPYKDEINYNDICISINIKDIDKLDNILDSIDETKYNRMLENYNDIKYKFDLEFMCKYITNNV